jgi:hypothetical protein
LTNKLTINGDIEYYGAARDVSDRRLKDELTALPANQLDKIMLLKPVSFEMKGRRGVREFGFVAQDVETLFPDLVSTASDVIGTKSLNYVGMIAPVVKALQEMEVKREGEASVYKRTMQELRVDNDNLRGEVEELRKELRELKSGVGWRRSGTR